MNHRMKISLTDTWKFFLLSGLGLLLSWSLTYGQLFNFNDGTVQGWTMKGAFDENGNGPFQNNFIFTWTDVANYPTPAQGTNNGCAAFITGGGHGITGMSGTYWIMQFHSPDLSGYQAWQSASGYSVKIVENITVGSELYVNLFVTVYDYDQQKERNFYSGQAHKLTYSASFGSGATWNTLNFDWSAVTNFPTNYEVRKIHINIFGKLQGLYEGQVGIDEVNYMAGQQPSPSLTITQPNGGEEWPVGSQQEIRWTSTQFSGNVKIEYSTDGNASRMNIVSSTDNDGSYFWTIPNTPSTDCIVFIADAIDNVPFDISDAVFTISTKPSGGMLLVTNTNDAGPGSIRRAINEANFYAGPDTILFQIPRADPGYVAEKGYWQIRLKSLLPVLEDDSTFIDGMSQTSFAGDLNTAGPEVELNGQILGEEGEGIVIMSAGNVIRGLAINQIKGLAIIIEGIGHDHNAIYNTYIGVDPTGTEKRPNQGSILIIDSRANIIGMPDNNLANVIGGNNGPAILIEGAQATDNLIYTNFIGTDQSMRRDLGLDADGILIHSGAHNNTLRGTASSLGPVVHNCEGAGIRLIGSNTQHNVILRGSISNNQGPGISLEQGANYNIPAPEITAVDSEHIAGKAIPNGYIQFYADEGEQGALYLGSVYADAAGDFEWFGQVKGPNVTATASDTVFNFTIPSSTSPFSAAFPLQQPPEDPVIRVTNTGDAGKGSFREAIIKAKTNVDSDTILFNIPKSDPGYDANTGVWIIKPNSELPGFDQESIYIDGYSQTEFIGEDTNPAGPEIVLDGSQAGENAVGIISYTALFINSLIIHNFQTAIFINSADGGLITGCYIGPDLTGTVGVGNGYGIVVRGGSHHIHIGPTEHSPGNIISGNQKSGISISENCHHISVIGNIIGLNRDQTAAIDNSVGLYIGNSDSNAVFDNYIGGTKFNGIDLAGANDNEIRNNFIGTNAEWNLSAGNKKNGLWLRSGAQSNQITDNFIGFNQNNGILVEGEQTIQNRISQNHISQNEILGIENHAGGNLELAPPRNLVLANNTITGTAGANQNIEIYADEADEGIWLVGTTRTNGSGTFSYPLSDLPELPFITAIAIDDAGNTSEFSQAFATALTANKPNAIPKVFRLAQNYPNPFNPVTEIHYDIPKTVHVTIKITNILGKEIITLIDQDVSPGSYSLHWNGLDQFQQPVAGGLYFYHMTAGDFRAIKKLILLK